MGRRGPKPFTADKLRLHGSWKAPARSRAEAGRISADPGPFPACPRSLTPAARAHWKRLAPVLKRQGLIGEAQGDCLAAYCELWAVWRALADDPAKLLADPKLLGLWGKLSDRMEERSKSLGMGVEDNLRPRPEPEDDLQRFLAKKP
ncbi:MAG: P27 family phage terminase small subunit [Gammaproteobacteria bacterium]